MSARRRRGTEVSLFAFQDVMASLIGVLFFIVLLLALTIVETPEQGASQRERAASVESLQQRTSDLRAESAELLERLAKLGGLASGPQNPARTAVELRSLHATLKALHEAIRRAEASCEADQTSLAAREGELGPLQARAEELAAVVEELKRQGTPARSGPRVSYIIDRRADTPEPWLVEVTSTSIRVASRDGAAAVFEFGGAEPSARQARFLAWAGEQDASSNYFVLLIKPSGLPVVDELTKGLKGLGFHIGSDLLPEGWRPFE